nr:GM09207p [Drosophila melanogaster]
MVLDAIRSNKAIRILTRDPRRIPHHTALKPKSKH